MLTYGGAVDQTSGSTVLQGTHGYFWSIGTNSTAYARSLAFYGSTVYTEGNDYKSDGFSVRCVICYTKIPFTLTYGGNVDRASGSTMGQGTAGYFWSISANSSSTARVLDFGGSYVTPENNYYKPNGFPVRCKMLCLCFPNISANIKT